MEHVAWTADDEPVVGVVDPAPSDETPLDEEVLADLESAIADRGGETVTGPVAEVLATAPSVLVAVGESTLTALVRADPGVPVVPVDAGPGVGSAARVRAAEAVDAALAGEAIERERPVLAVEAIDAAGDDPTRARALFDVALFTDEPAYISEYAVYSHGERVSSVRADGVVVATPAGTHGYAGAADGPHLDAAVDAVVAVPVAPFVTRTRRWVLPDDDLALSVERDEGSVSLVVDGRVVETITPTTRVSIAADGTLSTLVAPTAGENARDAP